MSMKLGALSFFSFIVLDTIWLGLVAKPFYISQLSSIGRIENGSVVPILWSALLVYILLSAAIVQFVIPRLQENDSLVRAFGFGALMGLIIYGVYDFTNHTTLKDWTTTLALADVSWGAVVCGLTAAITHRGRHFFN